MVDRNFCGLLGGVKRLFFNLELNGPSPFETAHVQVWSRGGGYLWECDIAIKVHHFSGVRLRRCLWLNKRVQELICCVGLPPVDNIEIVHFGGESFWNARRSRFWR